MEFNKLNLHYIIPGAVIALLYGSFKMLEDIDNVKKTCEKTSLSSYDKFNMIINYSSMGFLSGIGGMFLFNNILARTYRLLPCMI